MATCWERPAHLVSHMFSVFWLFVMLAISHFGFEGGMVVLIAPVSGHCILVTFRMPAQNIDYGYCSIF